MRSRVQILMCVYCQKIVIKENDVTNYEENTVEQQFELGLKKSLSLDCQNVTFWALLYYDKNRGSNKHEEN